MKRLAMILLASMVVGCAAMPESHWSKANAPPDELYRVRAQCQAMASGARGGNNGGGAAYGLLAAQYAAAPNYGSSTLAFVNGLNQSFAQNQMYAAMAEQRRSRAQQQQIFSDCMMGFGYRLR